MMQANLIIDHLKLFLICNIINCRIETLGIDEIQYFFFKVKCLHIVVTNAYLMGYTLSKWASTPFKFISIRVYICFRVSCAFTPYPLI